MIKFIYDDKYKVWRNQDGTEYENQELVISIWKGWGNIIYHNENGVPVWGGRFDGVSEVIVTDEIDDYDNSLDSCPVYKKVIRLIPK